MSLPLVNGSSRYFPLQQAVNVTQYTLGRTFLQEAYVTVNYERSTFQVQQAIFPDQSIAQALVAIQPGNDTITSTDHHASRLSTGAEVGIVAGGVVVASVVVAVVFGFFVRQRRKNRKAAELPADPLISPPSDKSTFSSPSIEPPSEMESFGKVELPVPAHYSRHELAGYYVQRNELPCEDIPKAEMMGSLVKGDYFQHPAMAGNTIDSRWTSSSTGNTSSQSHYQSFRGATPVYELPAHVPVHELDSPTHTYSTSAARSPGSPASGSSPATGAVSAFSRTDRANDHGDRLFGGWI